MRGILIYLNSGDNYSNVFIGKIVSSSTLKICALCFSKIGRKKISNEQLEFEILKIFTIALNVKY